MKISFLCGSFEPGHDGVGDYTRTLAAAMVKQGHEITAIALNDTYISQETKTTEHVDGIHFTILRLPSAWSERKRFDAAKVWLNEMQPELISLQFVIYSYHPKGLPFGIAARFKELATGRRVHLLFHELWIGFTSISSLKHKITGFFQRRIVLSIIKKMKPELVTTTNLLYQLILKKNGITANILPLFSNIPVAGDDKSFTIKILDELSIGSDATGDWIFSGIFGNLYPEAKLEGAIAAELKAATGKGKKLAFVGFGRINSEGEKEFERLSIVFKGQIKFLHVGEQPVGRVSNLLSMLDTGFSCTPAQHIGKSGVFAAMKLHDVNVVLPTAEYIPEYGAEMKSYYEEFIKRPALAWDVAFAADSLSNFLNHLPHTNSRN